MEPQRFSCLDRHFREAQVAGERYPIIKYWTAEDEARLREMLRQGSRPAQIAEALDRTPKAIRNRANQLGLSFTRTKKTRP
ncbi:SANT/Myb-like DNA-binding domain-containing protein [Bradyrhizobium canariense]|uniref:SANT/Myb-like DNA-binding domain-containing protein n=1 Tax=Bradyrhizobium canariense TaxID=255045 RepID=UPI003D9BF0E1